MKLRLTKTSIEALPAQASNYVAWDADQPGFGVRVRANTGTKTYIAMYRVEGTGKQRMLTIAPVGKILVTDARKLAKSAIGKAVEGKDEVTERQEAKAGKMTVAELCDEYLQACENGKVQNARGNPKKESTLYLDRGRIERHIKPLIGKRKIHEVDRRTIEDFLLDVKNGKTAGVFKNEAGHRVAVTGGEGTAKRTVRLLGGIFSYAVKERYIAANPRFGMKISTDNAKNRFLSTEEFARLADVLKQAETVGLAWQTDGKSKHLPTHIENRLKRVDPYAIAAIRLLMLTGYRLREILNLRWRDVDLQRGILNLPDSKTGKKSVTPGQPAVDLLKQLRELGHNGECVIAGADPDKPRSDLKRPWERITRAAGLEGLRLHDLRHSFASMAAAQGLDLLVIGKMLGHSSPATTARYAHLVDAAKARAADDTSAAIAAAMRGAL